MGGPYSGNAGVRMATERSTDTAGPVRDLVVEAARTQLAAVSAGIRFWAAWVESADRYTKAIGAELARLEDETEETGDLTARLADHTRAYLREMTTLPTVAVQHFNGELEKIGRPKRRRTRAAKVKE
jgi:hypothetical protein